MDGLAVADLKGVLAPLNFTQPMAEKPYSYNYEPPSGVPPRNTREEAHQVKILDGRAPDDRANRQTRWRRCRFAGFQPRFIVSHKGQDVKTATP